MRNTGDAFTGVEKLLQETFLLCILFVKTKYLMTLVGTISKIPVKKADLGLQNTVTPVYEKLPSSQSASTELIWDMMRKI